MEEKKYTLGTISDQVQGNYLAWVVAIPDVSFETYEEAAKEAAKKFNEDWKAVPEGFSLGYSYVILKDGYIVK